MVKYILIRLTGILLKILLAIPRSEENIKVLEESNKAIKEILELLSEENNS